MTPLQILAQHFAVWEPQADGAVAARTLDAVAAFSAGAATDEGRAILAHAAELQAGVAAAVARRVAAIRMTEIDDIHMSSCTTPGAVVIPTAVSVGAALVVDPVSFRRAVEIGYEAITRLGVAIAGPDVVYRGVWPTYFGAPFAAAAVVATLLDLDVPRVVSALGLALTRATGLVSGAVGLQLGRWLTVGDAARAGCAAAFAARDGFVADVDLQRIAAGAGIEINAASLIADRAAAVDEVSVKPFPAAKQTIAATEAALRFEGDVGRLPVRVAVPPAYVRMAAELPVPGSRLSRVSSASWNIALALARPSELYDLERPSPVDDPELSEIVRRVGVVADPEMSCAYPGRWPARVEVGELSETVVDATGDPPTNTLAAVQEKWQAQRADAEAIRAAAVASDPAQLDQLFSLAEGAAA